MLHHMELVEDDFAVRHPLENALGERLPHIHAGRRDPAPLKRAQLFAKELVQRLFFAIPAKLQRLSRFHIAHHG